MGSFSFDLNAKRYRWSEKELISALETAAQEVGGEHFTSTQYNALGGNRPHSATIIGRFGSRRNALHRIGISGGRERQYSPDQLIRNLEEIWKELSFPPGKRQLAGLGEKISETPYRRHWGSVRFACEALAAFHSGRISRKTLLSGDPVRGIRNRSVPLRDRWEVMKGDHFRCVKCGRFPSIHLGLTLEVDHKRPFVKGGGRTLENLQTLCFERNQGKKDR